MSTRINLGTDYEVLEQREDKEVWPPNFLDPNIFKYLDKNEKNIRIYIKKGHDPQYVEADDGDFVVAFRKPTDDDSLKKLIHWIATALHHIVDADEDAYFADTPEAIDFEGLPGFVLLPIHNF